MEALEVVPCRKVEGAGVVRPYLNVEHVWDLENPKKIRAGILIYCSRCGYAALRRQDGMLILDWQTKAEGDK